MAISRCSALLVALWQAGHPPPAPADSPGVQRPAPVQDSTDGREWLRVGRGYLRLAEDSHLHRAPGDTTAARVLLDSAEWALGHASTYLAQAGATPERDSAWVLRVGGWSERAVLAWEEGGVALGPAAWGPMPADLRLPSVLEELGENLLRACPAGGVLLTATAADSYAAWYMRFARGLRPDLLIVSVTGWQGDSVYRARLRAHFRVSGRRGDDEWVGALVDRRPVCVSMGFERPPDARKRVKWTARPLVWVAGVKLKDDRVPPQDFVFAALKRALDDRSAWAEGPLALYARAAHEVPGLCEPLATFHVTSQVIECRN